MARRAHLIFCAIVAAVALTAAAAPAAAAPGDPDPAFGTGGVALVPGTNRLSAQDAPLVQADGRIVATSLLPGDVLFLSRFTAAGQPDPSFGTGSGAAITRGTTTGIKAPLRQAATALAPGDKIVVAGGSRSGGTMTVGRFTGDGAVDRTFNRTGRLTVNLRGRKAMLPTAMLARPDGSLLITVLGDVGGRYGLTVVRITPTGKLDPHWGAGRGWVQVLAGTKPAAAFDLAALGDGSLVLAGGVLDAAATNPTDTAIAKLGSDGRPATDFGTGGLVIRDLSLAGGFDGALAVAPLATGGFFVAGPSGSRGMVARFTSTGALDGAFGTGGARYTGLAPDGSRFHPTDAALDGTGRVVVSGTILSHGGVSTATRWGVTRLDAAGTGVGFVSAPQQCANRFARGPSGLTVSGDRLLVAGSCNDKGTAAVMALIGRAFDPTLTVTSGATSLPAGYETIRLGDLDPAATLTAAQTIQSAPFRFSPFRFSPFRFSPFRFSPFRFSPFRFSPFRFSGGAFDQILLSDIPLTNGQTWAELLPAPLDSAPLQSITLRQVIDLPALGDLTFEDFDWSRTPIANLSLAALLLHPIPVSEFPPPAGRPAWPQPDKTFLELELEGGDLTAYYRDGLRLAGVDFSARTLHGGTIRPYIAEVPLSEVDLTRTPLHPIDTTGSSDLGELLQSLPRTGPKNVALGELLLTFIDEDDIPFERAPRRQLLDAAALRDRQLLRYTVTAGVDCPSGVHLLEVTLPGDARYKPGSSTLGAPTATRPLAFDLCAGEPAGTQTVTLRFDAEPGSALGPTDATIHLVGSALTRTLAADVVDADEDGAALPEGVLRTGHISDARDVDTFTVPAPPPGSQVTVTLSHLRADLDLEVAGPPIDDTATVEQSPFRFSPFRFSPFRFSPVPDPTGDPADNTSVAPNAVQDAPFRFSDERRAVSVKRGTADESVTLVSRESDQGGTFTVSVAGFDGATSPDAYVVRSIVTSPPPAPACIPARTGLAAAPPGALPRALPADTRTLVLVNEQRMRGLYPEADVGDLLELVRDEYLSRPEVRGELLAVDGSETVRSAYGAWDDDPCSVRKATEVVGAINDLVDGYRQDGGLPELRNIVLLGPDAAIPQMRVADESRLANESTFAAEMVFGGRDDPVSRALRTGYLFTDDRYGDVDPQSLGTRTLYVPDVALGRLVETPADIRRAIMAYADSDGVLETDTAFVAGYDFIADASGSIFTGLQGLGARNTVTNFGDDPSRLWDADFGRSGMNVDRGVSSVNAHFDTYRALPAADFFGGSAGLFKASETTPSPRTLLFTIGCHSGLSVAAAGLVGVSAGDERLQDWTQQIAGSGAPWIGQTGYGLGDSEVIAYSERLMAGFAGFVGREESNLGQSLMFAKQDYAATSIGLLDDYDVKTMQQATFYSLPTYVTQGGRTADPVPAATGAARASRRAGRAQATADAGPSSARFDFDAAEHPIVRRATDRGDFWEVPGEDPLVISRRPVQPRWSEDVTAADGQAVHGALVDHLEMTEFGGVDPVIARPTIDLSTHEPEPDVLDAAFPATLATVSPYLVPGGQEDRLTLFPGQFRPASPDGTGVQRIYTRMGGRVLRSTSDDYDPPRIRLTDAALVGQTVAFSVETHAGDGGTTGVVLFRSGAERSSSDAWSSVTLTPSGGDRLGGATVLPAGSDRVVEWTAQVADAAGNVGVSTNKVIGFAARPAPAAPGAPAVALEGETVGGGAFAAPPEVTLEDGGDGVEYQYTVDGGTPSPYAGPFTPEKLGDGAHVVRFQGSGGQTAEGAFILDTEAPTITASPETSPGPGGWWPGDVTVGFRCADAGAGVDPVACPGPVTFTDEGENSTAVSVADRAGRASGDVPVGPYRIDRGAPAAPEVDGAGEGDIELVGEDRLTGTTGDELSGVLDVAVTFSEAESDSRYPDGKDRTITLRSGCEATEGGGCAWAVPRPPDGYWTAAVVARDLAGNAGGTTVEVTSSEPCFDCEASGSFDHESFDTTSGLQLNGDAQPVGGALRLTPPTHDAKGSVFRRRPVSTRNSFTVRGRFQVDEGDADGMAFVLHRDPEVATALGIHGGGIGYAALEPSVAVEFDAFGNWDVESPSPHVAITRDGDSTAHLEQEPFPVAGDPRCTTIRYDAEEQWLAVEVFDCSGGEGPYASVGRSIDLREALGDTAFIGWTASTGGLTARQRLLDWSYDSTRTPVVVNGSFEDPDVATGGYDIFANGEVPGWAILPGSAGSGIEIQDRQWSAAPGGGAQWAELDPDGSVAMYQDVDTEPGEQYVLRFQSSPRPQQPAGENAFRVEVGPADGGAGTTQDVAGEGGGEDTSWTTRSIVFQATSPTTRITFSDRGPSTTLGAFVDDVGVFAGGG